MQYILSKRIRQKTSTVINFQFWEFGNKEFGEREGGKSLFVFADAGSHYF